MSAIRINFRATSGFVTDGAGETYCLAEDYPVTRSGWTFGWEDSIVGNSRDRSNAIVELAGINFFTNAQPTQKRFRVDLPSTGVYIIKAAFGDATNPQHTYAAFKDGTTQFATSGTAAGGQATLAGHFFDITSADFLAASFLAGEGSVSQAFVSTILRVFIGSTSGANQESSCIASLSIAAAAAGGKTPAFLLHESGRYA